MAITETRVAKAEWVNPNDLEPNAWNPNVMTDALFQKEIHSIHQFGMVSPIVVRMVHGRLEIVDGEQRWRAARHLNLNPIPVWNLGIISDVDAKELTILLNRLHGEDDPKKLGILLTDLSELIPMEDLLETLPISKVEFEKLAQLPEVDWEELEKKSGTQTWVERIYRLPAEAAEVVDTAIVRAKEQIDTDEDSSDWRGLEMIAADFLSGH